MAVTTNGQRVTGPGGSPTVSSGARMKVGANVVLATLIVIAIVAVLQAVAYNAPPVRLDMTTSGVNSLSEGTVNLLRNLETDVTLTSLYFKTDLEDEDQAHYRRTMDDLLDLYQSTNRSKIKTEWINPLSDHEKLKGLVARLRGKEKFGGELKPYEAAIDHYKKELDEQMRAKLQEELTLLGGLGSVAASQTAQAATGQIEQLLTRLGSELENTRKQIDGLTRPDNLQVAPAADVLRTLYSTVSKALKDIADFGKKQTQRFPDLPADVSKHLNEAGGRFATFVATLEKETTALQELKPPKVDDLLDKVSPNSNSLIVETPDDALVVEFSAVWPPADQNRPSPRARFRERAFKGEEKLTTAILRATHKEQTAAVFVRYGGQPLFMPGTGPGQPGGSYSRVREQLEDANFVVEEWDLKASTTPPAIEPKPTKIVYIVFKPTEPERPMGQQQGAEPPFSDAQRRALLDAIGSNGRALFVAGWHQGPFGPIPAGYEFNQYLKDTWGISVDNEFLLLGVINIAPGRYYPARREFFEIHDLEVADHPIVSGPLSSAMMFPWVAPLKFSETAPEGVKYEKLVTLPKRDTVWAVKNLQPYQTQLTEQQYMALAEGDKLGPFDLAVAASKGDAKIIVVSSRDFAEDNVALAGGLAFTGQGLAFRALYPGNLTLFINSLHWLSDNIETLNIGQPINTAVMEIRNSSTARAMRALTIFVWPALALVCGGIVWWNRRR